MPDAKSPRGVLYRPWINAVTASDCLELAQQLRSSDKDMNFDPEFVAEQLVIAAAVHISRSATALEMASE